METFARLSWSEVKRSGHEVWSYLLVKSFLWLRVEIWPQEEMGSTENQGRSLGHPDSQEKGNKVLRWEVGLGAIYFSVYQRELNKMVLKGCLFWVWNLVASAFGIRWVTSTLTKCAWLAFLFWQALRSQVSPLGSNPHTIDQNPVAWALMGSPFHPPCCQPHSVPTSKGQMGVQQEARGPWCQQHPRGGNYLRVHSLSLHSGSWVKSPQCHSPTGQGLKGIERGRRSHFSTYSCPHKKENLERWEL